MTDKQKQRKRVGRLNSIGDVQHELGRIFRSARREELDTLDASRLASILKIIIDAIRASDIEDRVVALEARINDEHRSPFEQT